MTNYVIRRTAAVIVLLLAVSMAVFLILRLVPGDPVLLMVGDSGASTQRILQIRHQLGLDLPIMVQFAHWFVGVLHGDFGYSYAQQVPVTQLVQENFPSTLELAITSLVVTVIYGTTLGIISAVKHGSLWDTVAMIAAMTGLAVPGFWLGLLLITLFAGTLRWFPVFGGTSPVSLVLPVLTLALGSGGVLARFVRSSVIESAEQQHVITARSKGLPANRVLLKHVLRNAMIPIVTVVGLQFGYLLSGAVIIETVFSRPGIGRLLVTAILNKDYPTVQICVLLITATYTLMNFLVDISYTFVDPRIRYS